MAALVAPEALKAIKPYITLASQLDQKEEKCIPYYCRAYAVQTGLQVNKNAPECKKFLFQLMDTLEKTKAENKTDDTIMDATVGQACLERFALNIFQKADDDDRQSRFSKNLVKQFYTAGLLFDVLNFFGELSEDLVQKKQYAKQKAMYLNKCLSAGETPIPGPLVGGTENDEFGHDQNEAASSPSYPPANLPPPSNTAYNMPQIPTNYHEPYHPVAPTPRNSEVPTLPTTSNYHQDPAGINAFASAPQLQTAALAPEALVKAQKLCKFAVSALQYEDIPTAVTNLEACLKILKNGK